MNALPAADQADLARTYIRKALRELNTVPRALLTEGEARFPVEAARDVLLLAQSHLTTFRDICLKEKGK